MKQAYKLGNVCLPKLIDMFEQSVNQKYNQRIGRSTLLIRDRGLDSRVCTQTTHAGGVVGHPFPGKIVMK